MRWIRMAILFTTLVPFSAHAQSNPGNSLEVRELWSGHFSQTSPYPWKGSMELYFRYTAGSPDPKNITGVVTWKELGNAQTMIRGTKQGDTISFNEIRCLKRCDQIVLGGNYAGQFDVNHASLQGKASFSEKSLTGEFSLTRVMNID